MKLHNFPVDEFSRVFSSLNTTSYDEKISKQCSGPIATPRLLVLTQILAGGGEGERVRATNYIFSGQFLAAELNCLDTFEVVRIWNRTADEANDILPLEQIVEEKLKCVIDRLLIWDCKK